MQYTIKDGIPTYSSDAADPNAPTQAERDAVLAFVAAEEQAQATAEAARLAKRPRRSEINALKTATANANSVSELRTTVQTLTQMMDNVLALQNVEVIEDE
jgi:hypothetical protein